jgi:hypothetical protein
MEKERRRKERKSISKHNGVSTLDSDTSSWERGEKEKKREECSE